MRVLSKRTQKELLLNHYNDLCEIAAKDVSTDIMKQTVCLLLYAMSLHEDNKYSDDELREIYDKFVEVIHWPEGIVFGKSVRSYEVQDMMKERLGIDLDRIDTEFKMLK